MRLNPSARSASWVIVANVNFAARRSEKAVERWEQARATNTDLIMSRIPLAALYESEGSHEEARRRAEDPARDPGLHGGVRN